MGSLIQSSGPGEINMITSALCISLLTSYCLSQPGYEDWMEDRCCPLKAVESASDESKNEMFALVEQVPWSQVEMENCTSNCAYVKMKDLKMVMEEMNINRLQKYCFAPTDNNIQSMCASMD